MAKIKTSPICYKGLCALALFMDPFSIPTLFPSHFSLLGQHFYKNSYLPGTVINALYVLS